MESSEDDAGTATSASRHATAREKNLRLPEDVDTAPNYQHELSETRTSCGTPAMSEDNFDGDSVPSPSAQDVNTSTEAILDMIDEFVDGPGAPKRVPLVQEAHVATESTSSDVKHHTPQPQEHVKQNVIQHREPLPGTSSECDNNTDSKSEKPSVCISQNENSVCVNTDSDNKSLHLSPIHTSEPESNTNQNEPESVTNRSEPEIHAYQSEPEINANQSESESNTNQSEPECNSTRPPERRSPELVAETETISVQSVSSSPSSSIQSVQNLDNSERTIKIVTSSDIRDSVTVEKAESTSSECSVSDSQVPVGESSTRSPLRRRLVRPAPSDRRPDSTVSSTVDSTPNIDMSHQTSEVVTKDVSSSSDAVPILHGNTKPEEISNVSEISICKAETSTAPSKKIKLIRPKIIPIMSNSTKTSESDNVMPEKDACQSTSSDYQSLSYNLPEPSPSSTAETIQIIKPDNQDSKPDEISISNSESSTANAATEVEPVTSESITQNTEQINNGNKDAQLSDEVNPSIEQNVVEQQLPSVIQTPVDDTVSKKDCKTPLTDETNATAAVHEGKTVPPIKLNLHKSSICNSDIIESPCSSITSASLNIDEEKESSLENVCLEKVNCDPEVLNIVSIDTTSEQKKVPPIKLNFSPCETKTTETQSPKKHSPVEEVSDSTKQVPKLTIKLGNKQPDELKSPVPKLTIKPLRPPTEEATEESASSNQQIPNVTRINIKPIVKPTEKVNDLQASVDVESKNEVKTVPINITKLNIKPITKPPEKINETHRKSSSSEISESECSENDETTSTSDQASASDQGPTDSIPKVTIKLGRPGTESEGKFYTEQNIIPKLTIKNIQQGDKDEQESKLKLVISQSDEKQLEKIPKLTIKTVSKLESQPLSPKLTIKPIKPENTNKDNEILKLKISPESYFSGTESKDNLHVPKITIKPVTKTDTDLAVCKTPKKSTVICDSSDHIPVITKLNIKPILKPESEEESKDLEEKVPVVSKLNIKPVVKPKDNEVDSSVEDVPKIIKLNIKPLKNPEENSSEEKDCDEKKTEVDNSSIPIVTKINIKPIVKPVDEGLKESENQSSETGNSSDENTDHIPVVTKLNIKPIVKPNLLEESSKSVDEQSIPVITKLNIKPLIKPEESTSLSSPKKESKNSGNVSFPMVTKLNIKPIIKPEEIVEKHNEAIEKPAKNPPLVMKINMKNVTEGNLDHEHVANNIEGVNSPKLSLSPKVSKSTTAEKIFMNHIESEKTIDSNPGSPSVLSTIPSTLLDKADLNCIPDNSNVTGSKQSSSDRNQTPVDFSQGLDIATVSDKNTIQQNDINEINDKEQFPINLSSDIKQASAKQKKSLQNCTLLKKLLSSTKEEIDNSPEINFGNNLLQQCEKSASLSNCNDTRVDTKNECSNEINSSKSPSPEVSDYSKHRPIQDVRKEANESVTKPLEISVTDKISNQSSGQDSPRIILKINKTDHGASAKIITEDMHKSTTSPTQNTHDVLYERQSPKKLMLNSRRKPTTEDAQNLMIGKRLRSSRIVESAEKTPISRRNTGKRPSMADASTSPPSKETELSVLETKRLKLEQILSANKSLTITPVSKNTQISPTKIIPELKQGGKTPNHSIINNENCPKNGNSKLHNILSSLQAKQMQSLQINDSNVQDKTAITSEVESNTSTGSSDVVVEITRLDNCHPAVQEMMINENSDFRDLTTPEEISQDPLDTSKNSSEAGSESVNITAVESTPQPRKRGRPRKLPVSEITKAESTPVVTALEERPQRSLRLTREKPAILSRPRGRGRGRGRRVEASAVNTSPSTESPSSETMIVIETVEDDEERASSPTIDPTSSRIKLPRMTEALDKSTSTCTTPLSTRRRSSASTDLKYFGESSVSDSPGKGDEYMKCPESAGPRGRGWRGGRGGPRGRTPRGRGRGRGGGRGATYMKETMGIYGRVCGPATTTVELFEEETCMMDDNATPSKPSHLLDEDSQSSVKSSTNDSNKMKKSKFADIFDSNKVWTAADVKEYTWPPPETPDTEHQVMMIQEQVAMFLGVKSFKRRYPELKRRPILGEEKDYVLSKSVVTEALCDLGITAVDASEVLDIMLSDYPHKYEEYRSHQRTRQLAECTEDSIVKQEEKPIKIEKSEKSSDKPEPPKVDPEKARQEMAAAAIASAMEWNARANALRRPACVDLQSMVVHRRRAPAPPPRLACRPPAGYYPHALLPGQYQHTYRVYTPDQLRYFPLNTVIAAPPAPASPADSSSESEGSWGERPSSSDDSDAPTHPAAKRKKLTKMKRSSQQEKDESRGASSSATDEVVDTCRVCKLRLEANRKYTYERFLVCANCNAKLHPSCLDLSADTIRKCREYAWQCAECKSCCACRRPQDDDKMLFCDLCDRGFHIYCVGLQTVPNGRWHCVECSICKSCGAREPGGLAGAGGGGGGAGGSGGEAEWHHQTRRGPGGHKVYSHSLCTPCARAYRIGRYCPLCERSFIGPKGTMQLVICKLCDRQLHQECVRAAGGVVRVLDYTCGECRRGGITSRAAAVRLAPRTIATLFMAKRRFNKYAHRQYLASRQSAPDDDHPLPLDPAD